MNSEASCSNTDYLTVDFNGEDQAKVCQVCGATPAGNHFDVVSCRPCSAFFRRTVVLKRNFVCKLKGNCPINKNIRSLCSHCRFKKCLNLGMSENNINVNYDKANRKEGFNQLPTDLNTSKTPMLDDMLAGFKKFDDEAKKLFFVCNPEELFSGEDLVFRPGTVVESVVFSRSQLVYTWEMLINHYHPFKDLEKMDKMKIGSNFAFQFSKLFALYLNTIYYTDDYDKLVMQYGRYVDKKNHEHFFSCDADPKKSLGYFINIQTRLFKLAIKFKQLKLDAVEVVVLSAFMLWKEAHFHFGDLRYQQEVNQIVSELTWYERSKFGEEEYKVRVGSICCIQHDLELLAITFHEGRFIGALINDHTMGPPKLADLDKFKQRLL